MHAQYAFVPVPHVARGTACCVSDEFIHGVHLYVGSAPLPLVGLLIFRHTASR